jgi:hypothetical protein
VVALRNPVLGALALAASLLWSLPAAAEDKASEATGSEQDEGADEVARGDSDETAGDDSDNSQTDESAQPAADEAESPADGQVPVVPEVPTLPEIPDIPQIPDIPALPALPGLPSPGLALAAPAVELVFSGFAALDWYQYFLAPGDLAPGGAEAVGTVAMVRVAPRLRARYQFLRAAVEIEFRHDFVDPGRGGRVILREAVVGLRSHGFRLEGGALNHRWGKMDVASPTDNVVAQDFEELLDPEPLPVPGLRGGFARGPVAVELLFIPAFVPSRFRHSAPSRWDNTWFLPRTEMVGPITFTNHYASFGEAVVPGADESFAAGFEGGGRVDLFLPSVDLGFSFLATHDRLPTYTGFAVSNSEELVEGGRDVLLDITPYHERLLVPGFDFAVNFWRLVIKGEAAYFHTRDPGHEDCLIDDPYVRYALGVELVLPDLMGPVDLALRVQYNGDVEIQKDGDDILNQSPGCKEFTAADPDDDVGPMLGRETGFQATPAIRHPYSHAWYFNVNLGFTPQFSLDLRGFADISGDALLKVRLAYLLLDRLELSVGGLAMLSTGEQTIFTNYGRNHRFEVGMKYLF